VSSTLYCDNAYVIFLMDSTPAFYSRGNVLKPQPWKLTVLMFLMVFLNKYLEAYAGIIPQVRPCPFPFTCYPTNFSLTSLLFGIF